MKLGLCKCGWFVLGILVAALSSPVSLTAQDAAADAATSTGVRFGATRNHKIQVGIRIRARGACRGIIASVPIPMGWPEQSVQVVEEDISMEVRRVRYRTLDDGVKQMVLLIPQLNPGEAANALLTFSVARKEIKGPEDTTVYSIPRRPERDIRRYLGSGPFIESRNVKIRRLAKELTRDVEGDWKKVETLYDYVRENVEYRESELKGAVDTLDDGVGDCEAMTSLFIALCRAIRVPARMVWVLDHSYPEFYLEDDQEEGHWFPCQISGSRAFGSMPETRTILQKGDNFKIPETGERRRYVAVQLKASRVRGGAPMIQEVMQMVP